LGLEDRRIVGTDIRTVEFGWPLGNDLFEVRSTITGGRIGRVLFCIFEGNMVLLHGFVKKTRKTPAPELSVALKRTVRS
jgi:phage-related protein